MEWLFLLLLFIDYSSVINGNDFQCLICDNFLDGPGCGEFTRPIPVRTCQTFCYFAVLHNRTLSSSFNSREYPATRAIRDCSPYTDMTIEGNTLLQTKIESLSLTDIVTIKRCNSEQCNNDFYLNAEQFISDISSSFGQISVPFLIFSLVIIFYYSKSMF